MKIPEPRTRLHAALYTGYLPKAPVLGKVSLWVGWGVKKEKEKTCASCAITVLPPPLCRAETVPLHTVRFPTRFARLNPSDVGNVLCLELAAGGQVVSAFEI